MSYPGVLSPMARAVQDHYSELRAFRDAHPCLVCDPHEDGRDAERRWLAAHGFDEAEAGATRDER